MVLLWATGIWEQVGEAISSYENFVTLFQRVFDHTPEGREVSFRILYLKQGQDRVVIYALELRTLAADSGCDKSALKGVYRQGLNANVIIELTCRDNTSSLNSLIDLSNKLDDLLQDRRPATQQLAKKTIWTVTVQNVHLSSPEQERRRKQHLCFFSVKMSAM